MIGVCTENSIRVQFQYFRGGHETGWEGQEWHRSINLFVVGLRRKTIN
jgi:hypothetical protein